MSELIRYALILQVSLFFFALGEPIERIRSLWGKPMEQRRAVVWPIGAVLKSLDNQLPINASIRLLEPEWAENPNVVYYLYPRKLITNQAVKADFEVSFKTGKVTKTSR